MLTDAIDLDHFKVPSHPIWLVAFWYNCDPSVKSRGSGIESKRVTGKTFMEIRGPQALKLARSALTRYYWTKFS